MQEVVALLAIANPLGAVPVFLAITQGMSVGERSRAGLRAAVAVIVILGVVAIAGRPLLAAFGISMPALQAAGGLVVLLMGLEMLHGAPSRVQHDQAPQSTDEQVLVPLAMPLMAGPGAITTVLTLSSRAVTWRDMVMLLMAVGVVGVAVLVILLFGDRVGALIGYRGQRILLRFMGLILAAVGAEILLAGVYTFVPRQ
ncbi:MAG TPA: MarC family protein [Gemmatimonadota bacterium]|nr:MarC family protein [Gemmatimonadota bacterium]